MEVCLMSPETTQTAGGLGELLTPGQSDRWVRSNLKLIGRAVRENWQLRKEAYTVLPDSLLDLALDKDLEVKNRLLAARIVVSMHGQNQADDPADQNVNVNVRGLVAQVDASNLSTEQLLALAALSKEP